MSKSWIKRGINFERSTKGQHFPELPVGFYTLKYTERWGFSLDQTEPRFNEGKTYGETVDLAEKVWESFVEINSSVGVLISGPKGVGKTHLLRQIFQICKEEDLPVIFVSNAKNVHGYAEWLATEIGKPFALVFEEFEKDITDTSQNELLTFLDGIHFVKVLSIFTCNAPESINTNLLNRPGRIRYHIKMSKLSTQMIREYCEENLHDEKYLTSILKFSTLVNSFSFDHLKAIVSELNNTKLPFIEALEHLNISPAKDRSSTYDVRFIPNSKFHKDFGNEWEFREVQILGSPLLNSTKTFKLVNINNNSVHELVVRKEDLVKVDVDSGHYLFQTRLGKIEFTLSNGNTFLELDSFRKFLE